MGIAGEHVKPRRSPRPWAAEIYNGPVKSKILCAGRPMTAVVLAGGRGSRMKADKAGLAVAGRTLLEHVIAQLEPHFDEVLVSVSPGQRIVTVPASKETGPRVVVDEMPGLGPLGGILSGLRAAANDACAVIACDIPDIDIPLLRSLAGAAAETEIAVPADPAERYEPLFAVYKRTVVPAVEALLRSGEKSVLPLYERCRTAVVRIEDGRRLTNLNTRADYLNYLNSLRRE